MTEHSHPHHALVVDVLGIIAQEKKRSLSKIKKLFSVKQDVEIANRFWQIVLEKHSKQQFTEVWRCHGCGKFGMDIATSDDQYQRFLRSLSQHIELF